MGTKCVEKASLKIGFSFSSHKRGTTRAKGGKKKNAKPKETRLPTKANNKTIHPKTQKKQGCWSQTTLLIMVMQAWTTGPCMAMLAC